MCNTVVKKLLMFMVLPAVFVIGTVGTNTTIKSSTPIEPLIIIQTESVNGKLKSDTTYIYKKP